MTAVLTGESGENKHDTIIPVSAPGKKSTTDFSYIDVGSLDGSFLWFMCMKLCFLLGMDYHRLVIDLFDFQFSHLLSTSITQKRVKKLPSG